MVSCVVKQKWKLPSASSLKLAEHELQFFFMSPLHEPSQVTQLLCVHQPRGACSLRLKLLVNMSYDVIAALHPVA